MPITLRDYQEETVDGLFNYFGKHSGNPLAVLPTAAGKSIVLGKFIERALTTWSHTRILMLTHVKELVEQNDEALRLCYPEVDAGIYSASLKRRDLTNQVITASIQSIYKRACQLGWIDLILIDECHLLSPNQDTMYRRLIKDLTKINPAVKIIGFTATPFRMKEGLLVSKDSLFTDIAVDIPITRLINDGYLCPLVSKSSAVQADLSEVHIRGGEYKQDEMQLALDKEELTKAALEEVFRYGSDRQSALFFCSGVAHAHHVADILNANYITAKALTGETPPAERDQIVQDFKDGKLRVITNCDVLTTGFNATRLDLIVLLRATKSPGLYIQMLGRGMRNHEGKQNCLVLDFAGNIERFGPIDKIQIAPKREGKKDGVHIIPVKICEVCREPSAISARECEHCGAPFPEADRINHDKTASDGALLSQDEKPTIADVSHATYTRHSKAGKPDSMKVTYFDGLTPVQSEWICLEHTGYARQKAAGWWMRRSSEPVPSNVDDAIAIGADGKLKEPKRIHLKKNGKYTEVVGYEF